MGSPSGRSTTFEIFASELHLRDDECNTCESFKYFDVCKVNSEKYGTLQLISYTHVRCRLVLNVTTRNVVCCLD